MDQKYYWLRLKRDFFKRHDIRIIEDMPNGKDYVLFYLKLLVESIDHNGHLRFSDTIPYKEDMLATITNTNVDIVRSAMAIFKELGFVELLDDATIYLHEVEKLTGSETKWAEKKRQYRLQKGQCPQAVLQMSDKSKSKSKSKIKNKPPLPPKGNDVNSIKDTSVGEKRFRPWVERFYEFWQSYPKKVGKGAAEKAFKKINPNEETFKQMLEAIEKAKKSDQWKKDNGQFIPYPATWLNQGRWEDELEIEIDDNYVTLWDGSARVPRYLCIKTERGWEEKSRVGEPSILKGE